MEREPRDLATKVLTVFDFMLEEGLLFPGAEEFRVDLEQARDRGNQAGLRAAWRDCQAWTASLTDEQRARLNERLAIHAAKSLEVDDEKIRLEAKAILARGVIRTHEEYRVLQTRLDLLGESDEKEAATIVALVAEFEG